jgi:uncharacterized protein (DUF433 family)
MISKRGSDKEVLERNAVPVDDVIESLVTKRDLDITLKQFPITDDEIWACVEYYLDQKKNGSRLAKIEISISYDTNNELCVSTESMTDWVYLTSLTYGRMFSPNTTDLNFLYCVGLENVMREILEDLKTGNTDFSSSALHNIVHKSFVKSYGELSGQDVILLLDSLTNGDNDET